MFQFSKFLPVAAASAALAAAAPATAAVFPCSSGPGINLVTDQCVAPGNDNLASVEAAIAAATGVNVSLLDLVLYGKSDDNPSLFSFSPNLDPDDGNATNWSVLDGTLINYITVKASTSFKVYQLSGAGASSGLADTFGMVNNAGQRPDISHLSFWTATVPAVPEPGTWAMMLLGFGAIGFALRRRKEEKVHVRFAF